MEDYSLKPKIQIPDITKIDDMRKEALNEYALELSKSVIENINNTINRSIIKIGYWEGLDAVKNIPTMYPYDAQEFSIKKKFIFKNKLYDHEYDLEVTGKNKDFEDMIKHITEDEQFIIRELLNFYIIGATEYSLKNGKLVPHEEHIKDYYPVQYHIYSGFLHMIHEYLDKGYKIEINDEKKLDRLGIGDGVNVIDIKIK